MATGPEHYREAERLAALAADIWSSDEGGYDDATPPTVEELATRQAIHRAACRDARVILAEAQVHATLALAAATAELDAQEGPNGGSATGRSAADGQAWVDAGAVGVA